MPSPDHALGFVFAALLLTMSPGPDNLMVLSLGASKGKQAGMVFGLGCALGCLSHTLLAVVGISAMLVASPMAFSVLRYAGGAYLAWLGIQALRHSGQSSATSGVPADSLRRLFAKGLLANAINPKVALFFLAFLPQFVSPEIGHVSRQLAVLGGLFTLQAACVFATLGYFSGVIGAGLSRRPAWRTWLDRAAGTVFIGLGLRMAALR